MNTKKMCAVMMILAVTVLVGSPPASAANYIGTFCWQLATELDILKLSVSAGGSEFEAHGSWAFIGGPQEPHYEMAATGSAFVRSDGKIELSLAAGNGDMTYTNYGDNPFMLARILLESNLSGNVDIFGTGGPAPIHLQDTLSPISCPAGVF
jgi:hypothetical protein